MTRIADTIRRAAAEVEEFRGDYEELAAVMRASWVDGPGSPYLYTADLLAEWLGYPGAEMAPTLAIYADGGLVAFAAGLPREVQLAGATRRVLISTFLTVAQEQKAAGYGIVVWSELMRRAAAAGYDGVVNYCSDGAAMHRMIETGCRLLDLPLVRVKSFSYLVGVLEPAGGVIGRAGQHTSARRLVDAASADGERSHGDDEAQLWRVWSDAEAAWHLSRGGSVTAGDGDAVVTGSVATVADAAGSRCLLVDDVLWGSAGGEARQSVLSDLLGQAAANGAGYVVVPVLGYADVRPFLAVGLVPSPHTMHAYLTLWSDPGAVRPVERYYLDVV
ncbi:MAG TPA: hypothetical protein VHW96_15990 [Solirubrobacteraceae bacterium]|jgi:hypothetical protein|nr:hypothetical protein [Solirubrobacteraceae bacterium]